MSSFVNIIIRTTKRDNGNIEIKRLFNAIIFLIDFTYIVFFIQTHTTSDNKFNRPSCISEKYFSRCTVYVYTVTADFYCFR